ncbi:hypothetical protein SLNWT_3772 [Streptomyces albus]|uniref:Uncharacterized protein n=1 Tax=Streptomyces albus (strain ATCC 21838 / DSM 41398 / FERM P-419 / JCM 4703 / NBRC 107858) TaxID=1081613 RepID=A0A0B5ENE1_STRA4|nr:hypothetical protein SLNWT_3772 [Streptomyces albus]AYN34199.1 hypothetical protein DUI70_3698 [Streptomyces albus]
MGRNGVHRGSFSLGGHSVAGLYCLNAKLLEGSSAHANSLIQKGLEGAEGA